MLPQLDFENFKGELNKSFTFTSVGYKKQAH